MTEQPIMNFYIPEGTMLVPDPNSDRATAMLVVPVAEARETIARAIEVTIGLGIEPTEGCRLCHRSLPCPIHLGEACADAVLAALAPQPDPAPSGALHEEEK